MSHFSVLVITKTSEEVAPALQPYHEFECTGEDDQYVQDVDDTEEARAEFARSTATRLKAPDGTLHSFFDDEGSWRPEFSQPDPSDSLSRRRTYSVPEGFEKVEVPTSQVETFAEWVDDYYGRKVVPFGTEPDLTGEHKYGYVLVDAAGEVIKLINRTNPDRHWDGWVVGGRWSGFLKLKDGAEGALGRKGLMGSCANEGPGYADQALKVAIDFAGMRDAAGERAAQRWDKAAAAKVAAFLAKDATWDSWDEVRGRTDSIEAAREAYNAQPPVAAIREAFKEEFFLRPDQFLASREDYVQAARDQACAPYAVVKDGQWIAKGDMGWFGMSDDKVEQADWNRKVNEMLDGLPGDTMLTIVDCHI